MKRLKATLYSTYRQFRKIKRNCYALFRGGEKEKSKIMQDWNDLK